MFLIASLGAESVYRFLIVLAVVTGMYLVYGIHAAAHHDALLAGFTAGYGQNTTLPCTVYELLCPFVMNPCTLLGIWLPIKLASCMRGIPSRCASENPGCSM